MAEQTIKSMNVYDQLLDISRDLASTLDLDELLNRIVVAAAELSDAAESSILLYDPVNRELYFQATTNRNKPLMKGLRVPVEKSIAGWIIINREPIIIHDTATDPRYYRQIAQATQFETRSLLGAPLIAKGEIIGVLEAVNKNHGSFTQDDIEILKILSAQAAVAIENSRLFQQSDLIADFVHELRTPLSSLNTAAHLMDRTDIDQTQTTKLLGIIKSETNRLSHLANYFLDIARLESGRAIFHSISFDPINLLNDCVEIITPEALKKNIKIECISEEKIANISGDPDKIKQAILNLLSNAVKYNLPGGKIIVQCKPQNSHLMVSVEDTGVGIPQEYLPGLFQKFFRVPGSDRHATGTGLGLSIVKKIIENHGGTIEVRSQVGRGTKFTILLPHITNKDN